MTLSKNKVVKESRNRHSSSSNSLESYTKPGYASQDDCDGHQSTEPRVGLDLADLSYDTFDPAC